MRDDDDDDDFIDDNEEGMEAAMSATLSSLPFEVGNIIPSSVFTIGNEGTQQPTVLAHPYHGAVLVPHNQFDKAQGPALLLRVPSHGARSSVGEPQVDSSRTVVTMVVRRENASDPVSQVMPHANAAQIEARRTEVTKLVQETLGSHFNYDVLTAAFQAMSPQSEEWEVKATVRAPYRFMDMSKVLVFKANTSDSLMVFPLEATEVSAAPKRARVLMMEEEHNE